MQQELGSVKRVFVFEQRPDHSFSALMGASNSEIRRHKRPDEAIEAKAMKPATITSHQPTEFMANDLAKALGIDLATLMDPQEIDGVQSEEDKELFADLTEHLGSASRIVSPQRVLDAEDLRLMAMLDAEIKH